MDSHRQRFVRRHGFGIESRGCGFRRDVRRSGPRAAELQDDRSTHLGQSSLRTVRHPQRRHGTEPRIGCRKRRHGVVHRFGQRNDLDRRHRRRLRRLEDREMHQLSTDGLRRQQLGKQADDHGARRLRLRRRHERGYRFATDRFDKLRCTESGSGCRQRQRIHLDSGRRHRRILEHLPHIDLRQSVPALHKSRRHDRFDRTRFGHRRRSQHLHAHRRMRELRRHDEYLCGLQGRTSGQHHLHPRHPVDHKRLHQPRRRRDDQLPIPRRRTALSVQCHRLRNHQFGQLRQRNLRPHDLPRHARSQYQQPRKDGQQHRRRRNRILQRRRLRNGRHQRNEFHGLYRKDQGRQRRARDQYQVRRRGLDGQRHSHGRRSRGSRGCGQLRQAARRMAKRKRRDLPADRHRHVRGRRMDTHRQGDLRHRKQQTHGLRNPLRRTFQRPGLPDPQSENGRCEQRGGGYIRIVRNFGTRRRDREFLVRHRLFVHRRVHSRFIERRSGRTGLRRYGA